MLSRFGVLFCSFVVDCLFDVGGILCQVLSTSPEDKIAFEAANSLCFFGPRLPDGGSRALISCLKRLYADKHLQTGVVVFVMVYRDILRHFSKSESYACGELLDEFSKTMAPDHRAACESSSRQAGNLSEFSLARFWVLVLV